MERLRALSGGESSLTPFLRGFQEGGFQADLQTFTSDHASAFKTVCVDGSHPLEWTQYHREYRDMYERHFEHIVQRLSMSSEEVQEYFRWLHDSASFLEDDSEDLWTFLDALTSSEDYDSFLQVMFAEVRKQQMQQQPQRETVWRRMEIEEVEEIEVTVPHGVSAGQTLTLQYLGLPYKVVVPGGNEPGTVFSIEIVLHKNCQASYMCAHCGVTFDRSHSESSISKCKRCFELCRRDVCYCNVSCQKADWPLHKLTCGKAVKVEVSY